MYTYDFTAKVPFQMLKELMRVGWWSIDFVPSHPRKGLFDALLSTVQSQSLDMVSSSQLKASRYTSPQSGIRK